ncbi:MAG: hypothetical protein CFH33_01467, partial [Alphaproteobacteria bacterium MarineAlpha9_Bin3]
DPALNNAKLEGPIKFEDNANLVIIELAAKAVITKVIINKFFILLEYQKLGI